MRMKILGLTVAVAMAIPCPLIAAEKAKIRVTGIVDHPVIDAVRDGILEGLASAGYGAEKLDYAYQSAQGNVGVAVQIAKTFVGEAPDVIVPISTPSSQSVVQTADGKVPVVFSSVTDPVGAGLVPNIEAPGGNVTGVSDLIDPGLQIAFIRKVLPAANRIGIITNPGEANSATLLKLARQAATEQGFTLVERVAAKTADVPQAAGTLVGDADAIYLPADNTVVSALAAIIQIGEQNKLPVFAADDVSVESGAIATLGFNYKDIGRMTGKIVAEVLQGKAPGSIPVGFLTALEPVVNEGAAKRMGVTIAEDLLVGARLVGAN